MKQNVRYEDHDHVYFILALEVSVYFCKQKVPLAFSLDNLSTDSVLVFSVVQVEPDLHSLPHMLIQNCIIGKKDFP